MQVGQDSAPIGTSWRFRPTHRILTGMSRRKITANRTVLPQGALIEFIPQGGYVKVSAVDPVTYIEVSIVGDPSASEHLLSQIVVKKLERIVYKRRFDKETLGREADRAVRRTRRQETPSGWDL